MEENRIIAFLSSPRHSAHLAYTVKYMNHVDFPPDVIDFVKNNWIWASDREEGTYVRPGYPEILEEQQRHQEQENSGGRRRKRKSRRKKRRRKSRRKTKRRRKRKTRKRRTTTQTRTYNQDKNVNKDKGRGNPNWL